MLWDFLKYMGEIVIRLQIICLGGLREAICDRTGFRAIYGVDQMPVILSHAEAAYRYFGGVVIKRYCRIGEEHFKVVLLI